MKKTILAIAAATFFLVSCNSGTDEKSATETATTAQSAPETASNTVLLKAGDNMKFDKSEITVNAGESVTLTLQHTGTMPKTGMGHNFVLLKQGVNNNAFATKALEARDHDYIPENSDEIIAHTKLLGGGEDDTIVFPAPEKGTYEYLCTFPGHAAVMHGKFIVQ